MLYFFARTIFQSLVKQQELSASKKYSYPDQLLVSIYLVYVLKNFVFIFFKNEEIKSNAANYLPEISEILNSVPREMLLIFKTNDLLRGIECALNTRSSAVSLLTMSRSCVRSVYHHRMKQSATWWSLVKLTCEKSLALARLSLYEWFLWATGTTVVRILRERFSANSNALTL